MKIHVGRSQFSWTSRWVARCGKHFRSEYPGDDVPATGSNWCLRCLRSLTFSLGPDEMSKRGYPVYRFHSFGRSRAGYGEIIKPEEPTV